MSQSFIDRSQQSNTSITPDETTQKKIDPVAQLKWLNSQNGDQGFGIYGDSQPAQMFASDEEEQVQRKSEEDLLQGKAKDEELQMKPEEELLQGKADEELQIKEKPRGGSSGTKTSMPEGVKGKMENSFGTDFSGVNIHQNSGKASGIGALAYTQGNDVHFAPGQYNPGSQKGQELLGHELTHVVQQRQGRVKATKQGKGMPINDNPALEKEADVMGAMAAHGKMADVTGKSSGVQRKDTIIIPDIPSSFEGLDVIGYEIGEYMNKGLIGDGYSMRLLLAGDSEGWKNVLKKYGDKYHNFNDYILPFLAESTGSYWGIRENNPDKERYKTWSSKKMASVSRTNKVEFLKALYDTDPNSESAVDLPNSAWEADANVLSFVDRQWKGLAEFISMYQNLIIQEKSKEGQYFEAKDIAKLAEQGHTDGQSIANCPYVVEAMVQNAVATAVNALKSIVFISQGESDNYKMDKKYIDMVKNSARIASATINQYDSDLKSISSGAGKVFDALWSTIPFAGTITKIVEGEVRGLLKAGFGNMMELGGKFSNSDDLKQELADQFDSETNKLYNPENKKIYINPYQLTTIQNAFRLFLNEKS